MPLIPIFVQNELDTSDTDLAERLSAWNFCSADDHILPFSDGSISNLDRQHLWGMYAGIAAAGAAAGAQVRLGYQIGVLKEPKLLGSGM